MPTTAPPSQRSQRHCVVVGAGISGLAAAHRLRQLRPDLLLTVLEAAPLIGGKLAQAEVAGLCVDTGAESVLNRRPEAVDLIRSVGLGNDLCHPATAAATVWSRGALRPLPPTVLGVPVDLPALARSGVMSRRGLVRARMERMLPANPITDDVAVGRLVRRRLGREVVHRLLEPLLGGVYAGHPDLLSLRAAAPQVAALAAQGGSLLSAAAREALRRAAPEVPVFAGIVGGVGRLPTAVADASGAEIRTSCTVRGLRRTERGWSLVIGCVPPHDPVPTEVDADAVVLAVPAAPAARLLEQVLPSAAVELHGVESASVAVVTLAVPVDGFHPRLTGSGFLVPAVEGRAVKAATWSSLKWGWVGERAGAGTVMVRVSFGRHREAAVLQRDDASLVRLAVAELGDAVGLHGPLVDARVTRWGGALPQYAVGHLDRVARVRRAVAAVPHLDVCGASYDGIGIAACVADGRRAADRVAAGLGERATMQP